MKHGGRLLPVGGCIALTLGMHLEARAWLAVHVRHGEVAIVGITEVGR